MLTYPFLNCVSQKIARKLEKNNSAEEGFLIITESLKAWLWISLDDGLTLGSPHWEETLVRTESPHYWRACLPEQTILEEGYLNRNMNGHRQISGNNSQGESPRLSNLVVFFLFSLGR